MTSLLDFQLIEVGERGISGAFAEQHGEVGRGISRMGSQVGQCEPFFQVLFHEVDGGGYDVVLIRFAAGGFPVLLEVA